MMRLHGFRRVYWLAFAGAAALALGLVAGAPAVVTYGVSVSKGCNSPTFVGKPMQCFFVFDNGNPSVNSHDTVTLSAVTDELTTANGTTTSGNILPQLLLVAQPLTGPNKPSCTGPGITGSGKLDDPWLGATLCTLPYGSNVSSYPFTVYDPTTLADYNAFADHQLNDKATFTWQDLCDKTSSPTTCNKEAVNRNQAPSSTTLSLYTPTITTLLSASGVGV